MKRVIIIGGGFAGLSAASALARRRGVSVRLVDRKPTSDYLPLLPDLLSGRIGPASASLPLRTWCEERGIVFVQDNIEAIDLKTRAAVGREPYSFDGLIVAAGSRTSFHGRGDLAGVAMTLDDTRQAMSISERLNRAEPSNIVVAGGGYTGIEIAAHLWRRFRARPTRPAITIVEPAPEILAGLPEWMRDYTRDNLARLGIEAITGCGVESATEQAVRLENGTVFERCLLLWAAGKEGEPLLRAAGWETTPNGRLLTDSALRLAEGVYAAGDAAGLRRNGKALRMSIQFSLVEGRAAARNLLHEFKGRRPVECRPADLGYVIPMANGRSCGLAMGARVRGPAASALHYFMCAFRAWGWPMRLAMLRDLANSISRG